jgi:hypothetical protein
LEQRVLIIELQANSFETNIPLELQLQSEDLN